MRKFLAATMVAAVLAMAPAPAEARPMYSGKWKVCATPAGKHVWRCIHRAEFLAQQWEFKR